MDHFTSANQALFDGNRGEIAALLADAPLSGRTLWLLACAADEGDERMALLARVHASAEQPYADMAYQILERERQFAEEIARIPGWQVAYYRYKPLMMRSLIALPLIVLIVWLGSMFIFPPSPTSNIVVPTVSNNTGAAQETIAPTALPTATVTPLPMSQSAIANYMPIGSLRLLNIEYPTQRAVSAGTTPADAPPGSAFVAVQYEFTCGTAQAFCDSPPQALLGLELSDSSLGIIQSGGLTLRGSTPAGRIASGSSVNSWVVFAIPENQSPRRLLIGLNTDQDDEIDATLALDLPR